MFDYTVKDSSLWQDFNVSSAIASKNMQIRVGMVQEEILNGVNDETYYMVDVLDAKGQYLVPCIRMTRFGSPYNYEEYTRQAYEIEEGDIAIKGELRHRPGEMVVIAFLNGGNSEGIILGSVNHPYRAENLDRNNEVAYVSEFNGIETYITKEGEWRQTFRGIQTNIAGLSKAPNGSSIAEPEYDLKVGTSYIEWDKTGSWHVTDNSIEDSQSIKVNKPDGKIEIISGKTSLIIDKNEESYIITNKKTNIISKDSFELTTKETKILSESLFDLKAEEIKTEGKWSQKGKVKIKGNTKITGEVKIIGNTEQVGNIKLTGNSNVAGTFSTIGQTLLAGGAKPLITDIIIIIGVGNLGAPVVSSATILTTVMTKAT